ncbi:unnamed protein product [Peronospora destructor]|uniref:Uncharacterized protein n=1 Tax=Peronospora destructor TaxID=86335 RepID=A0AAV0UQF9_9STRA|nr:unnamed protein product [Peronospora destructor]
MIVTIVSAIVMMAVMVGEMIFHSRDNVLMMMRESGAMNGSVLSHDILELDDFFSKQNTTCGFEIQTLTNRVIGKVNEIRAATPNADEDDVRVEVSKSPIMTEDIPIITNHCMGEVWTNHTGASAYSTRRVLRKALDVIIEQLIKDGTIGHGEEHGQEGKSGFPICGPTEFFGEIDDGYLYEALGLTAVDAAFEGSYVIYSGGEKINEVKVPAGGKVTWNATVNNLKDKTLYMDRWRPGLFGLPGSGGGSLLLWVPRSSLGGYLILHARINVS